MHGLDKDTNLAFLLNAEVHQVCIGAHDAIIRCDGVSFSIEGQFTLCRKDGDANAVKRGEYPLTAGCISHLIGASVRGYEVREGGTLVLRFSNGDELLLFDDSLEYESYHISSQHGTIVV
jgi:hypothetical protein